MNKYKTQIFKNGTTVMYNGSIYVVNHVIIRGFDLFVKLYNHKYDVNANELQCEITSIKLER